MARIKGIQVILYDKVLTGKDAFNRDIYEETPITIDNVLVAPATSAQDDITGNTVLNGKHAAYQLAIPKEDEHVWEDRTVEFFGEKWRTIGFAAGGIEDLIPLEWNRKIMVERYG